MDNIYQSQASSEKDHDQVNDKIAEEALLEDEEEDPFADVLDDVETDL